jgi:transcriptional repressor NrdR
MMCPYCQAGDHGVLESRVADDGASIRRRRECARCHKRFTTYERVEGVDLKVLKKDGSLEDFDRESAA